MENYLVDDNNNNIIMTSSPPLIKLESNNNETNNNNVDHLQQQIVMVSSALNNRSISSASSTSSNSNSSSTSSVSSSSSSSANNNNNDVASNLHPLLVTNNNQQQEEQLFNNQPASSATTNSLTTSNNNTPNGPKPRGRKRKIRTEPIRPICPQCEKQFSNQSALTKHKLTHSDERKFACNQCAKAFKRHDHLTGHMQTHSNRKPFNCTIQGCDKTYCDARSLRRHMENIHHIVTLKENNHNNNKTSNNNQNSVQHTTTTNNNQNHQHIGAVRQQSSFPQIVEQHNSYQVSSYSADYDSAQHFSFEFNNNPNLIDSQQINSNTVPHSADSVTTSSASTTTTTITNDGNPSEQQTQQQISAQNQQVQYNNNHLHPLTPTNALVNNSQSLFTSNSTPQNNDQQMHNSYQQPVVLAPPPSFNHPTQLHHQQPTLLRRRIQKLHGEDNVYGGIDEEHINRLEPIMSRSNSLDDHHQISYSADYATTQQFSFPFNQMTSHNNINNQIAANSNNLPHSASITDSGLGLNKQYEMSTQQSNQQPQLHHAQPLHHNHHQAPMTSLPAPRWPVDQHYNHQAPYSADYATNQHFLFDFNHNNNMDQQVPNAISHSTDNTVSTTTDNTNQQQQMYQTNGNTSNNNQLHPSTPNNSNIMNSPSVPFNTTLQQQPQQQQTYQTSQQRVVLTPNFTHPPSVQQQPTLLRRRIQRLHSDGSVYSEHEGQLELISRPLIPSEQHHHQASYSADCALTQHFSFDPNHITHTNIDHQLTSSNNIPHSADSITDSGLGLNVQCEQQQLHQLTPTNNHHQHHLHHHQQQQLHLSHQTSE